MRVNPALAKMMGYSSPEEAISSITDIGSQVYRDSKRRSNLLDAAMNQDNWVSFENSFRRKDKSTITANLLVRKVRKADGTVDYLEGFVEDITERKRAEQALRGERRKRPGLAEWNP